MERKFAFAGNKSFEICMNWREIDPKVTIIERSNGYTNSCIVPYQGALWILNTINEAKSRGIKSPNHRRKPLGNGSSILIFEKTNSRGRFIAVDWFTGNSGEKIHHLVIPEGNRQEGWSNFIDNLQFGMLKHQEFHSKREGACNRSVELNCSNRWPKLLPGREEPGFIKITGVESKPLVVACKDGPQISYEGRGRNFDHWDEVLICTVSPKPLDWRMVEDRIMAAFILQEHPKISTFSDNMGVLFIKSVQEHDLLINQKSIEYLKGSISFTRWWPSVSAIQSPIKDKKVWITLLGIPFHLWSKETVQVVLDNYGSINEIDFNDLKGIKVLFVCKTNVNDLPRTVPLMEEGLLYTC